MSFTNSGSKLQNIVYKIAGPENKNFITLAFGWEKIIGEILAERAFIHKIENNVLFVAVSNNTWMQELVLKKQMIISKIKMILNIQVSDIIFFISHDIRANKINLGK